MKPDLERYKNALHAPSSEKVREYEQRIMNNKRLTVYMGKKLNKLWSENNEQSRAK